MVFNTIFNNISVISWRSVLLVEETGVPGENHQPVACHWQTLSQNVISSTPPKFGRLIVFAPFLLIIIIILVILLSFRADLRNYWTEFRETWWSYRYMFLVDPKVFRFVVNGVKAIFLGVQRGLMVTYNYVKFYVSIIIHLEVININVRNFNFPIGFYSNPTPFEPPKIWLEWWSVRDWVPVVHRAFLQNLCVSCWKLKSFKVQITRIKLLFFFKLSSLCFELDIYFKGIQAQNILLKRYDYKI
jgi:hypothetical protein